MDMHLFNSCIDSQFSDTACRAFTTTKTNLLHSCVMKFIIIIGAHIIVHILIIVVT